MLRFLFVSFLMLLGAAETSAQSSKRAAKDVLIRFDDGTRVSREAFEYVYQKNNGGYTDAAKHSEAQYREYLDLFVDFRRKVMDAEARGLDTTASFQQELAGYIKQLAQPYLIEKEVLEDLIAEAHTRSQQAVRVSHILLRVGENPTPEDTLRTYQRALALHDSLKGGADFATLARRYSEDPSAQANAGNLGWFSVFDFIYPFEQAAYQTEVGKTSKPVRTRYGYHLIKVHEKMPTKGLRNARHILVRWGRIYEAKDSLAALARAHEVYQKLRTGANWDLMVETYSDDPNSKNTGGDLGTRYISVPEMQAQKYALKPGEISQPFASQFGFHVMMVEEPPKAESLSEARGMLKPLVSRDTRAQMAEEELVRKLKSQYGFREQSQTLKRIENELGATYLTRGLTADSIAADLLRAQLFSFKGGTTTVRDLIQKISENRRRNVSKLSPAQALRQEVDELAKTTLLAYEEQQLADKYPEFRHLTQEYRDGILLFSLTEEVVWRRAVEDSTGLLAFYEANKNKYQGGQRLRMMEYRSPDSLTLSKVMNKLQQTSNLEEVAEWYKAEDLSVRQTELVMDVEGDASDSQLPAGHVGQMTQEGNLWAVLYLVEHIPPGPKSFEEAKSEVITDYQAQLETEWLKDLAQRYPYKLNDKVFRRLFK